VSNRKCFDYDTGVGVLLSVVIISITAIWCCYIIADTIPKDTSRLDAIEHRLDALEKGDSDGR